MNIYEKTNIALSGWVITKVGMVDRYRYLVIGQWNNDDNKTPYKAKDGEKYDHPTRMFSIDIKNNKITWNTSLDGYSHGYCDGGHIGGNMEAFFISYNGITYHLDYGADTFKHEELLGSSERIKKGISRGSRGIKLIGNHFYSAYLGNQIHRRDTLKKWTLLSQEPREYCEKFGGEHYGCDIKSLDGFSEQELYFSGDNGNLWALIKKEWHKISTNPQWQIENVICAEDGKVYAVDTRGGIAVGREEMFQIVHQADEEALPYLDEVCYFQGKLYGGGAGSPLYVFDDKKGWIHANLPLIGSVETLCTKDGVMLIAGAWTLKVYNGKETIELYGGERELNELLLKGFMKSATEVLDNADKLLDGMKEK